MSNHKHGIIFLFTLGCYDLTVVDSSVSDETADVVDVVYVNM